MKKYLFIVIPIIILLIVLVVFIWVVSNKKVDDSLFSEEINQVPENNNDIINEIEDEYIASSENATDTVEIIEANPQKEETVEDDKPKQEIPPSPPKKSTSTKKSTSNEITKKVETKTEQKVDNKIEVKKEETQQSSPKAPDSTTQPSTESKKDEVKEETIVRCTTANNHGMSVGNTGKWFSTKAEAVAYYDSQIQYWDAYWQAADPDDEAADATYYKNCPTGYEVWTCMYCSKWTINFYYR